MSWLRLDLLRRRPAVIISLVVLALLFLLTRLSAQGVYYVDPDGNDSNSGSSPGSAWRSVGKVSHRSFSSGDKILFKRGGVWREQLVVTSSGSAEQPIVYGAYGDGPAPVFQAWDDIPDWNAASSWSSAGSDQWRMSLSGDPFRVRLGGVEYMLARDAGAVDSRSRWHWSGGTLTVYATGNPATEYESITQSNGSRHALLVRDKSYVQFVGLAFEGGAGSSVELSNADNMLFDSCAIGAFAGQYGMFVINESDDGVIRNCRLDRMDDLPYSFETPHIGGEDCLAIQWGSHWDVHHNFVAGFGHTGINLSGSTSAPGTTWVRYNRIHHNEFTNAGADYGRPYATEGDKGGTDYCAYNDFYANYIHNVQTRMQITGGHNRLYYNIIDTVVRTPWYPSAEKSGAIQLSNYRPSADNEIYNNLIMNCEGAGLSIENTAGLTFRVINNIFYRCGLNGAGCYINYTGWQIWTYADYGALQRTSGNISNNLFYFDGSMTGIVGYQRNGAGNAGYTVSAFNNLNGSFGDTIRGNVYGNPLLTPDYRILPTSPAHNAGIQVGLNEDYFGNTVAPAEAPDIGPCQLAPASSLKVPPAPAPSAPPDGASGLTTSPLLAWDASSTAVVYHLQVSPDRNFQTLVLDDSLIFSTWRTLDHLGYSEELYWRVRARNMAGYGPFSASRRFTTLTPPPLAPALRSPDRGAEDLSTDLLLVWDASPGATHYHMQVAKDAGFRQVVKEGETERTVYAVAPLEANTTYYWRVRAHSDAGESGYSEAWDFTTMRFPLPAGSLTVVPETLRTGGGTVRLSWTSTGADSAFLSGTGTVPLQGTRDIAVSASTSFGLELKGQGGSATYGVRVVVTDSRPSAPILLGPTISAGQQPSALFRWLPAAGAERYELQVARDPSFTLLVFSDSSLAQPLGEAPSLAYSTAYIWRVRAFNRWGAGQYSGSRTFFTGERPLPSGTFTVTPDTLPAAGGLVTVSWTSVQADSTSISPWGLSSSGGSLPPQGVRSFLMTASGELSLRLANSRGARVLKASVALRQSDTQGFRDVTLASAGPLVSVALPAPGAAPLRGAYPAVMSDGISPLPGDTSLMAQCTSYDGGPQHSYDWFGYEFSSPKLLDELLFQEGIHAPDGGWWDSFEVQVQVAGAWVSAEQMVSLPPYPGKSGVNFGLYRLQFKPVKATGIRLCGVPGGSAHFASVAELRVRESAPSTSTGTKVPKDYALEQNFPNPFNPATNIVFRLPVAAQVVVKVFNILGQEVAQLLDAPMEAGTHAVRFVADNLANGVYFYFVRMGSYSDVGKMLLLR